MPGQGQQKFEKIVAAPADDRDLIFPIDDIPDRKWATDEDKRLLLRYAWSFRPHPQKVDPRDGCRT